MGYARCIMGFAGHMIDAPRRKVPRFPPEAESGVRSAIRDCLERYKPEIAVSSAACGGDIIFAEEAIKLGIPTYIILPFEDKKEFITQSVAFAKGSWVERFYNVLRDAQSVLYIIPKKYRGVIDYIENQIGIIFFLLGIQEIQKIQIVNMFLYDNQAPGAGPGGTHDFLELYKSLEKNNVLMVHETIDLVKIREQIAKRDHL